MPHPSWVTGHMRRAMKPIRRSRVVGYCPIHFTQEDSMADPNKPDPNDPRLTDPLNPVPPLSTSDPRIANPPPMESRGGGSTWLIALIVIALAIAAYYIFVRGEPAAPPAEQPAAAESAPAPAEPAPAPAPAEPAPAPAPAEPAPAPAPAEPAPAPAPTETQPAPAEPAPAPAN